MGKELDRRSDLYSMACTMYEFLTMAPPFPSENIFDTIYSRVHGKRPATQELCAWQIPEALAKLILQALNKEPDSRPASAAEFKRQLLDVLNEITLDSSPALSPSLATHSPRRISWNAVLIGILILGLSFFGFYFFCKQEQSHDFKQTTETMSKRTGLLVAEASNFYKIGDYERSLSIYEQIIQANDKRSSKDEPNPLLATCLKDASRSASELYSRTGEKDTDLLWRSVHYSSRASRLFSAVPKYRIECIQQELIALSKLHEYDKVEQVIASMYRADDDIWARLGSIEAPVDTLVACKHYDSADKLCRNYLNQIAKLDDVEYPRLRLKLLRADIKFHRDEKLKGEAMNDAESVANTLTAEQHIAGAERTNLLERLRKLLLLSRTAFLMNFLEKEKKSNLPLYQATPGSDAKLFLALGEAASRLNKYELAKQYYKESLRRNKVATKAELTDLYCKNGLKEIEEKEKKGK
jgi:tetratricopeptide (TPR) repeat protein